ncbi:hypothetical protein FNV43_RR10635 [Rhamnella rubrinervis]|uniref:Uncharacterized protein n=1 Tax=Rhamnella rubrinervis TaxID=2594499 RepID=A0A8K0MGI0_9ROSA|nr:hypothetical protein FNV43_RR10635 [Rhamnella rubrinervis]
MADILNTSFIPSSQTLRRNRNFLPGLGISGGRSRTQMQAKIREIFMPGLSSTMTEGKIMSWVKSEGDKLSEGYLAAIMVEEGGVANVGSVIEPNMYKSQMNLRGKITSHEWKNKQAELPNQKKLDINDSRLTTTVSLR